MKSILILIFGLAASARAADLPRPVTEIFPNGLQVNWYVDDKLPLTDIQLVVKSGNRDDLLGKSGTAELLANVLDRGAGGLSAAEISRTVDSLGGSRWITVDDDSFLLGVHGLSLDAPKLVEILGKIALEPDFSAVEIKRERDRLLDRWNHLGDYAESMASLVFHRLTTRGTDYSRGNFVSTQEFKQVDRPEIMAYHRRHFTPKNTILTVLGRVDQAEFRRDLLRIFGQWTGEVPSRNWVKSTDPRLPDPHGRIILVDRPGVNQVQVRIGFRAPLVDSPDHVSLRVGNALLGEYFHSRLNSLIRDQLGLTYGISSAFAYSRGFAHFVINVATQTNSVGALIENTQNVLQDLSSKGPSVDEVETAKQYLVGGFPLGVASLSAVANRRLADAIFGLPDDFLDQTVPKILKVDRAQVAAALARHMDLEQSVIVIAGDRKEIIKSLNAKQRKQVRFVSLKDLL